MSSFEYEENIDSSSAKPIDDTSPRANYSVTDIGSDWPSYHDGSLFESAILDVSETVGVSRELAIFSALGAMSAACQGLADVAFPDGKVVAPTSLMLLTLADSGERKSTVSRHFEKPIKAVQKKRQEQHQKESIVFDRNLKIWKLKEKDLEKKLLKQGDEYETEEKDVAEEEREEGQEREEGEESEKKPETIADKLHALDKKKPVQPHAYKLVYENVTPAALMAGLAEHVPIGYLISDEAGSQLKGSTLQDLPLFNKLWSGDDITVDRRSVPSFTLSDARLSVLLMSQPRVFQSFLDKRGDEALENGFLPRFLVCYPKPRSALKHSNLLTTSDKYLRQFQTRIDTLMTRSIEHYVTQTPRCTLEFDRSAQKLWRDMYDHIEEEKQPGRLYEHCSGHASKLMENTSRVAALMHILENQEYEDKPIDRDTLYWSYLICRQASNHYIKHIVGPPEIVTLTTRLIMDIRKHGTYNEQTDEVSFKRKDIQKDGYIRLRESKTLNRALASLEDLGHLRGVGTGGQRVYFFSEMVYGEKPPKIPNGTRYFVEELPRYEDLEIVPGKQHIPGYHRYKNMN